MYLFVRLLAIYIIFSAKFVWAISLSQGKDEYNPSFEMHYLVDKSGAMTKDEVLNNIKQAPTLNKEVANFGMTSDTHWFYLTLENINHPENTWYFCFNYPLLAHIDFYDITTDATKEYKLGSREPFSKRMVKNSNHILIMKLKENIQHEILIRVQTDGSLEVPISIETPASFHKEDHIVQALWGIYAGSIFIMFVYYLLIGIGALSLEYILMAYFFLAVLLFRLSLHGFLTEFLFPEWMAEFANQTVLFFTANIFFAGVVYSYKHLPIKKYKITRIPTLFCIGLFGFYLAISMFIPYKLIKLITESSMLVCVTMCFSGSYVYFRKGYNPAKYFLIGWTALLISGVLYALQKLGILPHSDIVSMSVEFSTLILVLALSIGQTVKFNELNRQMQAKLEVLVKERTNELEEKSANIKCMLDNIDEAIFTVESVDGLVGKEQSKQCERILGQRIDNVNQFVQLIEESNDTKSIILNSINASIGQSDLTFEMNKDHLPGRVFYHENNAGKKKILNCSYQAIANSSGEVNRLLIAIKDITDQLEMEAAKSKHDAEMKMILEIIQAREMNFNNNISIMSNLAAEAAVQFAEIKLLSGNELFRTIHTIKGNSRAVGLSFIATCCHNIEELLAKPDVKSEDIKSVIIDLQEIIKKYKDIYENELGFKQEKDIASFDPKWLKDELKKLKNGEISKEFLETAMATVHFNASQLLGPLVKSLAGLSKELGKDLPDVKFLGDMEFDIPKNDHATLINAMNHILRNAIDHGLETPEIRKQKGKNTKGRIEIIVKSDKDYYELWIRDDGAGFDLNKIAAKAKNFFGKDLAGMSAEDILLNSVFLSRFTTRDTVSEISGRGIGLDAVKVIIEKARGKIMLDCSNTQESIVYLGMGIRMPIIT